MTAASAVGPSSHGRPYTRWSFAVRVPIPSLGRRRERDQPVQRDRIVVPRDLWQVNAELHRSLRGRTLPASASGPKPLTRETEGSTVGTNRTQGGCHGRVDHSGVGRDDHGCRRDRRRDPARRGRRRRHRDRRRLPQRHRLWCHTRLDHDRRRDRPRGGRRARPVRRLRALAATSVGVDPDEALGESWRRRRYRGCGVVTVRRQHRRPRSWRPLLPPSCRPSSRRSCSGTSIARRSRPPSVEPDASSLRLGLGRIRASTLDPR